MTHPVCMNCGASYEKHSWGRPLSDGGLGYKDHKSGECPAGTSRYEPSKHGMLTEVRADAALERSMPQSRGNAPPRFILYTEVHDYEGTFGAIEQFYTQEEALQAAVKFTEGYAGPNEMPGSGYCIIEGVITLDER